MAKVEERTVVQPSARTLKMSEEERAVQAEKNAFLFSVVRISDSKDESRYALKFKGDMIAELVANQDYVYPVPHAVNPRQLAAYLWQYRGNEAKMKVDPSAPFLTIRPVGDTADPRGITYPVSFRGTERENEIFSLIATFEGNARGGHWHPYDVSFAMPKGRGAWLIGPKDKPMEENLVFKMQTEQDRMLQIAANDSHLVVALEDMLITETAVETVPFSATNDINRGLMDRINSGEAPAVIEALHRQLIESTRQ